MSSNKNTEATTPSTSTSRRIETIQRHVKAATTTSVAASTAAKVMQELQDERSRASFLTRVMTLYLDGGEQFTQYREEAMQLLADFPEFITMGVYDMSLEGHRETTLRKVRRLYQLFMEHGGNPDKRDAIAEMIGVYDLGLWVRNGVHFGLFMGNIISQGDKEQHDEWLVPLMTLQIFGCFAMTELGHGSHTRGLETTATFDPETDEFVIHTPTDTATKWWIGAAGETATHTVCFAQLVINGESKGLQSFVVPLRDPETHEPLPGIRIGDCGSKMGVQGVDNGWIQFDQVRVPRFNMLRRYASVSRDGVFTMNHKAQLAYSALIGTRGKLVTLSNGILKKALTIAVRYCATRRQGDQVSSASKHPETKLLDYQSHQYRLMPLLAKAYAYHFQTSYINSLISKFEQDGGDLEMDLLADIHGTMAGFKAFSTWDVLAAIEECRQSCGGNGYSAYNALPALLADFSVIVTFEGDNTVMAQQTGSYVLKAVDAMKNGQKLSGAVRYLVDVHDKHWGVESEAGVLNLSKLRAALRFYAAHQVLSFAETMARASKKFGARDEAWNHCQVDAIETARVHVFYSVATRFIDEIEHLQQTAQADPKHAALTPALTAMCQLFVLYEFDRSGCAFFLRHAYMTPRECSWIRSQMLALCARVRQDAVPLVDAFNLRDHVLNSSIGRFDGNIYQNILEVASKKSGVRIVIREYKLSVDGYELQFATNFLGHFALPARLFNKLKYSDAARIVMVSSMMHRTAQFNVNELSMPEATYECFQEYSRTKLYLILFMYELNRRLREKNITNVIAVAAHPGIASTNITAVDVSDYDPSFRFTVWAAYKMMHTPEKGALPTLFAAAAPSVQGSDFYGPNGLLEIYGHPQHCEPSQAALSEEDADLLWAKSEGLAKVIFDV
ncbi:hypothetical protein Poli38472_003749 [Pythium oligandrum]|uniref:acyl-CoA oxidase n=1 Tax=Pythium oligandrum TaxID=41045 RepID=A0A8K1FM70_PYTOL|nr:hypothetical protein Poli38472_003749 [Pythium oligandrum]|eukprot:TMW65984.1 hypothetical protein Poli38472_003749 [Pythium oligandrum]